MRVGCGGCNVQFHSLPRIELSVLSHRLYIIYRNTELYRKIVIIKTIAHNEMVENATKTAISVIMFFRLIVRLSIFR